MNLKLIVDAVVVIGVGVGAVVVAGDALPGGTEAAESELFRAVTPSDGETATSDSGRGTTTATATSTGMPPFGFTVDTIEECGQTCRDMTSTLTNQQDTTAGNATVYTRIFAGQGTDGDEVWRETESVGTLSAGDSHTTTRQVELSFADGLQIETNGGWITVETADGTVTFTDERQVA